MHYSAEFFDTIEAGAANSARKVVPIVLRLAQPRSVVDVGCGRGGWLKVFQDNGITDVLGIDGDYVDRSSLLIAPANFQARDWADETALTNRNFELAICLEVAEHLPASVGPILVQRLTELAPIILFSAAVPGQGGVNHVNEQWPTYWKELFWHLDYVVLDPIRSIIWNDPDVEPWYAQNILFFVQRSVLPRYPELAKYRGVVGGMPLSVVHPKVLEWQRERTAEAEYRADLRNHPPGELLLAVLQVVVRAFKRRTRRATEVVG